MTEMKVRFRKPIFKIFLLISLVLLVVVAGRFQLFLWTEDAVFFVLAPAEKISRSAANELLSFFRGLFRGGSIARENLELRDKVNQLLAEKIFLETVEDENKILREALNLHKRRTFELLPASVASYRGDLFSDYLIIDKGVNDGISPGYPVISASGSLIGKITETSMGFSKVGLISDPSSLLNVLAGQAGTEGVLRGMGTKKAKVELVETGASINTGDFVVSSSRSGLFPEGLLVGTVEEVLRYDIEPFQEAVVKPLEDFNKFKNVFIITNFSPITDD